MAYVSLVCHAPLISVWANAYSRTLATLHLSGAVLIGVGTGESGPKLVAKKNASIVRLFNHYFHMMWHNCQTNVAIWLVHLNFNKSSQKVGQNPQTLLGRHSLQEISHVRNISVKYVRDTHAHFRKYTIHKRLQNLGKMLWHKGYTIYSTG